MSKEVKRYDPFGYDGLSALMHEDADGGWVRVENYEALRLELAEANADFVRIANERDALLAERDRLKEALAAMLEIHGVTQRFADTHIEIPQSWVDVSDFARAALQGEQP